MSTLSPLTVLIQNQSQLASQSNSPKVSPNGLSLALSFSALLFVHYKLELMLYVFLFVLFRFTKEGVLVEGLFWNDVEALIKDYANEEPKKKK